MKAGVGESGGWSWREWRLELVRVDAGVGESGGWSW